ncbi:MAG: ABC transporter ATP-binding protein [Candidatus Thorarchaeota archaeon]|jgi:ABC-type branched-subunit amino acid transport system ATPase component
MALLEVNALRKSFGGLVVLDDIDLSVEKNEIRGIIGPNGSGKTTLINVLSGVHEADDGVVIYDGKDITNLPPHQITHSGLGRTFQVPKPFMKLTVMENLLVSCLCRPEARREDLKKRAKELLEFVDFYHLRDEKAKNLSGGQQKLLEFLRVLLAEPKAIMLDEPFAGVHPTLKAEIIKVIQKMNEEGVTFVIISHDTIELFGAVTRVSVLVNGTVVADGSPEEIKQNTEVLEAYLACPTVEE